MKRRFKRTAAAGLIIGLLLLQSGPLAGQESNVEYQVKAAFLYNFAKFIDWPPTAFLRPDDPFTICLAGDPFAGALDKVIQGEVLNGRKLSIRRMTAADSAAGCQIVYVAPMQERRYAETNAVPLNSPILTVGETEDFINNGGMIRFIQTGHRIQFQINADAVSRTSLKVSSRLLRLAEIVRPKDKS